MSESKLVNKYDNSDQLTINEKADKFLGTSTGTFDEVQETSKYINYLKLLSEIEDSKGEITVGDKKIPIKALLPARSAFEEQRLRIIGLVNTLGVEDPLVKGMMRDFGTDSVFELSSAYSNFALSKDRADKIYQILNGKTEEGGLSIFDSLLGSGNPDNKAADAEAREKAKKALASGKITIGVGASYRQK